MSRKTETIRKAFDQHVNRGGNGGAELRLPVTKQADDGAEKEGWTRTYRGKGQIALSASTENIGPTLRWRRARRAVVVDHRGAFLKKC